MNGGPGAGYFAAAQEPQPVLNSHDIDDRAAANAEETAREKPIVRTASPLLKYGSIHWNDAQELSLAGPSNGVLWSAPAAYTKPGRSFEEAESESDGDVVGDEGVYHHAEAQKKRYSWDTKGKSPERRRDNAFDTSFTEDGSFRRRSGNNSSIVSPQRLSWASNDITSVPRPRRNASGIGNTYNDSPQSTISKRRKRRSNTWNALLAPSSQAPSGNSSTDDHEDGHRNRSYSSMSPRRSRSPSPTLHQHAKRGHIPRSASEFVSSSSQDMARYNGRTGQKAASGRKSPTTVLYTRSRSSGDVLAQNPIVSRTSSSSNFSGFPAKPAAPPLRTKSSGLYMRSRQASTSLTSPTKSIDPEAQYATIDPEHRRKRTKSNLLNTPDGSARRRPSYQPETAPVGRTFSSTSNARQRTGSSAVRSVFPAIDSAPSAQELEQTGQNETGNGQDRLPKSKSRPFSIAGLMDEQGITLAPANEPSLQDLLKQVDVKGALALVREVQSHAESTSQANGQRPRLASVANPSSPIQSPRIHQTPTAVQTALSTRPSSQDYSEPLSLSSQLSAPSMQGSSTIGPTAPLLPASSTSNTLAERRRSIALPQKAQDTLQVESKGDGIDGKRKRRLSLASFRTPAMEKKARERAQNVQDSTTANDPNVILENVSPTMFEYVSQVKSELETRYLPIYTALAAGNAPPNPAEVARWRHRKDEIARRRRLLEGQDDPYIRRSLHSSRGLAGTSTDRSASPSLLDKLRSKGHRHLVWEVYPRDFANFANAKGAILEEPLDLDRHGGDALRQAIRPGSRTLHRPQYQRHASSELSLSSLRSIQEGQALDDTASDIGRSGTQISNSFMTRKASLGSSNFSLSNSARSGSLTHDEALALATSPRSLHSSLGHASPHKGVTYGRSSKLLQQSPKRANGSASTASANMNGHASPSSPSAIALPISPDRSHRHNLSSRLRTLTKIDTQSTVHKGGESYRSALDRDGDIFMASVPPSENEPNMPSVYNSTKSTSKPTLSRHSSQGSSIVNLGRILGSRRSYRAGNETDGYKSTDNEEATDTSFGARLSRRAKWRASMPALVDNQQARIVHDEESEQDDVASVVQMGGTDAFDVFGGKEPTSIEVVDVDDVDYDRADSTLRDLQRKLAHLQDLAPPQTEKLQNYIEEFYTLDTQRQNKGQLAHIEIEEPPQLPHQLLEELDLHRPTPINKRSASSSSLLESALDGDENLPKDASRMSETLDDAVDFDGASPVTSTDKSAFQTRTPRIPHLDRVGIELAEASSALQVAYTEARTVRAMQEATKSKLQALTEDAFSVTQSNDGIYQQVRRTRVKLVEKAQELERKVRTASRILDNLAAPLAAFLTVLGGTVKITWAITRFSYYKAYRFVLLLSIVVLLIGLYKYGLGHFCSVIWHITNEASHPYYMRNMVFYVSLKHTLSTLMIVVLAVLLHSSVLAEATDGTLKVATLNIRGAAPDQSNQPPANLRIDEEYPWSYRKGPLVQQVLQEQVDIIGFNEVRAGQLNDLVLGLGSNFDYVSHETGSENDVSNPVFWRKDKLELVEAHYFWLSKTSNQESKGWDASMFRIATVAQLRLISTKEALYFTSTHLDPRGRKSRIKSADLLLKELIPLAMQRNGTTAPLTILAGDLNSSPNQEAYQVLTGRQYIRGNAENSPSDVFIDLRRQNGKLPKTITYHGFMWNSTSGISDYLLAADNGVVPSRWQVTNTDVVSDRVKSGNISLRISDHRMVTATLTEVS